MARTPFSVDDAQWPLVAVLTWIATRSLKFTEAYAVHEINDADAMLALAREGSGTPYGLSYSEAFQALCEKIKAKEVHGRASLLKWVVPQKEEQCRVDQYFSSLPPPERFESCVFRPQDKRNRMVAGDSALQLEDYVFHDGDCLTPKGSGYGVPNPDGSRDVWSWQGATFARDDVLRSWPNFPCVAAWKMARAGDWRPPKKLSPDWMSQLPRNQYVSIADVVALLAFGPELLPLGLAAIDEMAARFNAGRALVEAAQNDKVTLCGRAAFRLPGYPGGLGPATELLKVDPESCADLTLVIDGAPDWLGPMRFADEYAECGQSNDSVAFIGVMVHRESLSRWLAELAGVAEPRKRGARPKYDWAAIKAEAHRLMDHHGDFLPDEPEWNAQARLENALLDFCWTIASSNSTGSRPRPKFEST